MYKVFEEQNAIREKVTFNSKEFKKKYLNSIILVTGAAGSIGKELSFLLNNLSVKRLILLDQSETGLFYLKEELLPENKNNLKFVLGSIRDKEKINQIFKKYKINLVIHAAAYKHVPLIEDNFYEAIRTNVEGTVNLFNASVENNVKDFLFISTDKTVKPKSKMGVSKKIAEIYLNSFKEKSLVNIKIIRFGNVINSQGSVIPVFKEQFKKRGYISLHNKEATRFFIYIDVVAKSVLNIATLKNSGNYLLKMGTPILIYDLAKEILGNNLSNNIKITSLHQGEKLHELLINEFEDPKQTKYFNILKLEESTKIKRNYSDEIINIINLNKQLNIKEVKNRIERLLS